ncbi:hypothetical protein PINS_up017630 [Pythium insidiosum]|nr:hypothetical protein PINS_up017630 [Pythium insidiosum]
MERSMSSHGEAGAWSYRTCIAEIDKYLASVPSSSEYDVAILFHWNKASLDRLAANASALLASSSSSSSTAPTPPSWLSTPVSSVSLVDDILLLLQRHAGGRWSRVCLAPNSPSQFLRVIDCLCQDVETHPFMQRCLRDTFPTENRDESCFVLQLASVSDRESASAATPIDSPAPTDPNARALFR